MMACAAVVSAPVVLGAMRPAAAGLLSGVTCPLTGTVNKLVGVLSAGWDDGATTAPTTMAQVVQAIGATQLWSRGVTGSGVGVAVIDSGAVPVQGLAGVGKIINGPDLSFESQTGGSSRVLKMGF